MIKSQLKQANNWDCE